MTLSCHTQINNFSSPWILPIYLNGQYYLIRPLSKSSDGVGLFNLDDQLIRRFFDCSNEFRCCLTYTHNGQAMLLFLSNRNTKLCSWNPATGEKTEINNYSYYKNSICNMTYKHNNQTILALVAAEGILYRFNIETNEIWNPIKLNYLSRNSRITCCTTYNYHGRLVLLYSTSGNSNNLYYCDAETGQALCPELIGHTDAITCCAIYEQDGQAILVSGSKDGTLRLWNGQTGEQIGSPLMHDPQHHSPIICCTTYRKPNQIVLISAAINNSLVYWDAKTGESIGVINKPLLCNHITKCIVYNRNNQTLAVATCEESSPVYLWNTITGNQISAPLSNEQTDTDRLTCQLVYKHKEQIVLCSSNADNALHCWDMETNESIGCSLIGHQSTIVCCMAYYRDGQVILVSASRDGTLRLWNPETGGQIGVIAVPNHDGQGILSCTVYNDGDKTVLVSGGYDSTLYRWNADTKLMVGQPLVSGIIGAISCCKTYRHNSVRVLISGNIRGDIPNGNESAKLSSC